MKNYILDKAKTEISVNTPTPPRRLDNMLYNKNYMTMIDHPGYSIFPAAGVYMDEEGRQCRILPKERAIYIRDNNTKKYFSIGYAPACQKFKIFKSTSGLNYQTIENESLGIKATWRIYVPSTNDPLEIWDLKLENKSGKNLNLSIFTLAPMPCEGFDTYGGDIFRYADYDKSLNAIFVKTDAQPHKTAGFEMHNSFFASSAKINSHESNLQKFLGEFGTAKDPIGLGKDKLDNSFASVTMPTGSFKIDVKLNKAPEKMRFLAGICSDKKFAGKIIQKYISYDIDSDKYFDETQKSRRELFSKVEVSTPDESINIMFNKWVQAQIHYGATWGRWGWKGYRDVVQQAQGVAIEDPMLSRKNLLKACAHQYKDGFALRGWHPLDTMRYADSAQWMIFAFSQYSKETGDLKIFDETVKFLDEGEASVYEHLVRALEKLFGDKGERGMSLIHFGDWNDSLTGVGPKGKGESVWLSMAFCRACLLMEEIGNKLGKDIKKFRRMHEAMKNAINKYAWDGDWYICAIDDDGKKIGTKKNKEGKIFLNMQSWAVLGKVCDDEKYLKLKKSVKKYLDSGWGLMLNYPTYTRPVENVGRLSYLRPGICENGSVYTHGNAFYILALMQMGDTDEAYKIWQEVNPSNSKRPFENQPNVFTNGYFGPYADANKGRAEHVWTTGSASWMYHILLEYFFGLKINFEGIKIEPSFPSSWKNAYIKRVFRGVTYFIEYINSSRKKNPVVHEIFVDEKLFDKEKFLPMNRKKYNVKVILK